MNTQACLRRSKLLAIIHHILESSEIEKSRIVQMKSRLVHSLSFHVRLNCILFGFLVYTFLCPEKQNKSKVTS